MNMRRREMLRNTGLGIAGFAIGSAFTAPACDGVSKDKAVKYAGFVINYLKDLRPLVVQIGGTQIADLIDRAIPIMEKLKEALEKSEIPTAENFFNTVTSILGQIATALLQLPESTTRNTVMGILTIVNVTLRTVSLFVESQSPPSTMVDAVGGRVTGSAEAIRKAFEATRF